MATGPEFSFTGDLPCAQRAVLYSKAAAELTTGSLIATFPCEFFSFFDDINVTLFIEERIILHLEIFLEMKQVI